MTTSRLLARIALDLALWLCAPLIFLLMYTTQYALSGAAIWPHLRLVLLLSGMLGLARITCALLLRRPRLHLLAAATLLCSVLYCLLLYYAVVLIGLRSWGRVISWTLASSYLGQASELAATLEVSFALVLAGFILAYGALFVACWRYLQKFDWSQALVKALPGKMQAIIWPACACFIALQLYTFAADASTLEGEPVSLSLFSSDAALHLQNNAIDRLSAAKMDRLDDAARAAYQPAPQAQRRNVVLIVVDALRPDHLGPYGYARDTTPYLMQQLQQMGQSAPVQAKPDGARPEPDPVLQAARNVRAACSESACGSFSLLTSKYIHQFSERPFTLLQVLQRHDYQVRMILSSDHTNFYGLRKIYGKVDSYFDGSSKRGKYSNDDQLVLEQTAQLPDWNGRPHLLQFHLMSNHVLGVRHQPPRFTPAANYAFDRQRGQTPGAQQASPRAVNYYDSGVVETDAAIHTILQTLKAKGYLHNTTVVITADHGELLGEHGLFTHANSVWDEVLRIPFIMLAYGYQSRGFSAQNAAASQVDIAPTILAELAMPAPATWVGAPLQDKLAGHYSYFQEGFEVGLIDQRDPQNVLKYWVNLKTGTEYAFNLNRDPHEQNNLAGQLPAQQKRSWRLQQLAPLHGAMNASRESKDSKDSRQ